MQRIRELSSARLRRKWSTRSFYYRQDLVALSHRPLALQSVREADARSSLCFLNVGSAHSDQTCNKILRPTPTRPWTRDSRCLSTSSAPPPTAPNDRRRSLPVITPTAENNQVVDQNDQSSYEPVDFETRARIEGEESHVVTVELEPGECVRAESGSMIFMTDSIQMNTTLAGASSAFQRMMTGQNLFLTDFICVDKPGTLCLGTDFPSKILRLNLQEMEGEALICQRGAYLASNPTVSIEMEFTKNLSTGFFGGQGFVLQKLSGRGDVMVKGGGTIVVHDLRPGEKWRVTSGSIVAFESSVVYDIQMMPGIKNAMFGGEGLFVTTLTGPGRVWLQGMPPDRMIAEIASRVPRGSGLGFGIPIMGGGGSGGEAGDASTSESGAAEQVAATNVAVEADRQATVATSGAASSDTDSAGLDADTPSALFGDAAPEGGPVEPGPVAMQTSEDSSSHANSQPSFEDTQDRFSTTTSEPSFDDTSFSDEFSQNADVSDGELFDDTVVTDSADVAGEAASDAGPSLLSTLWDFFMGDDE